MDLDDTLIGCALFDPAKPFNDQYCFHGAPQAMQWLLDQGCEVVIFTARAEHLREACVEQLRFYDIPYTRLIMDKPQFDVLVDNKAMKFAGTTWSVEMADTVYREAHRNRTDDLERYEVLFADT
jgi:hypothetical protein